jgi:hypothetical protein
MSSKSRSAEDRTAFAAVVDAAELAQKCDGYWQDRRSVAAGWEVHYAVDVDVIKLFADPEQKPLYARVFSDLSDEQVTLRLAELLGQYVMLRLPALGALDQQPAELGYLIMLPPHDDEYDRLRLAVIRRASEDLNRATGDLNKVIELVTRGLVGQEYSQPQLVDHIVAHFGHVVEAFDGLSGASRELTRLSQLSKRLLNLYRVGEFQERDGHKGLLPLLQGHDSPDREAHFELVCQWRERLRRHRRSRSQPEQALLVDATALATLQMFNARSECRRIRLALVTGSDYLLNAAAEVKIQVEGQRTNFARAFLRHPQAFFGTKNFFQTKRAAIGADNHQRSQLRIFDWLNLFLPKVLIQNGDDSIVGIAASNQGGEISVDKKRLHAVINGSDKSVNATLASVRENNDILMNRTFPESLLEIFSEQIRQLATDFGISSEKTFSLTFRTEKFLEILNKRLSSGLTVTDLQKELDARIEETVFALYLQTGEIGVIQLLNNGDPVRGVPALRFDKRYRDAQAQSEKLCLDLWRQGGPKEFDLGTAYALLDADGDNEHYHARLIHAQVYAARGHWFATRTLSRLALRVVEHISPAMRNGRVGREAAYLMAVAERRLARRLADLDHARSALLQAKMLDSSDRSQDSEDPRFISERLAQRVTQLQFERFEVRNQSLQIYPLAEILVEVKHIIDCLSQADPVSVQSWVKRQAITNALLVALLAKIDNVNSPDDIQINDLILLMQQLRSAHLAPDSDPDENNIVFGDGLSSFVYDVAAVVFSSESNRRAAALRRLRADSPLGRGAPPFEQARKELFINYVQSFYQGSSSPEQTRQT